MKNLLIFFALLGLAACGSSTKTAHKATEGKACCEGKTHADKAHKAVKSTVDTVKTSVSTTTNAIVDTATETLAPATSTAKKVFSSFSGTPESEVTCTSNDDIRTISVLKSDSGECGVVYTKFGASITKARAKNDLTHCPNTQVKIQGNLEEAGFDCVKEDF